MFGECLQPVVALKIEQLNMRFPEDGSEVFQPESFILSANLAALFCTQFIALT